MSLELTEEMMIEGVARAMERMLPAFAELVADRVAEKVAELIDLVPPRVAAGFLDMSVSTLREKASGEGLDKFVGLGREYPFFSLTQLLEKVKDKVVRGADSKRPTLNVPMVTRGERDRVAGHPTSNGLNVVEAHGRQRRVS
jgi:hypothetical protein